MVLDKALTSVWAIAGWINPAWIGQRFTMTTAIALAVAVVAGVMTWRHKTTNELSREVVVELKKVSWPTYPEARAATIVVIVFSFILAAILGAFDWIFSMASDGLFRAALPI
ncbi:MAG: preprotein translocase subunit SecE [Deltaproteobacteria bacterium]|nr:preprotein translocase subunit SecE [Deltaproteobacteria bacterium]